MFELVGAVDSRANDLLSWFCSSSIDDQSALILEGRRVVACPHWQLLRAPCAVMRVYDLGQS